MIKGREESWREIWERKGAAEEYARRYEPQTLIQLDGFDIGLGKLDEEAFRRIAETARRELELGPGMRLLEVGCGAGALMWHLRDLDLELFGVDYSSTLIEHARRAIPEATFAIADAADLPFEADAILCHSVFQYFPDYAYAEHVLEAFRRVAPVALVMDVPDIETSEQSEVARRDGDSKPKTHLHYPRAFFGDARTWANDLPGYGNATFRFNALLK
jgi:cyclopropane fatty-acyl-phospholipid synthase-like methyltransferase